MAKTTKKKVDSQKVPRGALEAFVASQKEKMPKTNGLIIVLDKPWLPTGMKQSVLPGGKFVESNDGWFLVYDSVGEKMHYRVSPQIVEGIANK